MGWHPSFVLWHFSPCIKYELLASSLIQLPSTHGSEFSGFIHLTLSIQFVVKYAFEA